MSRESVVCFGDKAVLVQRSGCFGSEAALCCRNRI